MTTGHNWNGIKELNTPVPLILLLFLAASFVFSVGYWIMMPAWPGVESYTRGTLEFDQRKVLTQQLAAAEEKSQDWTQRFAADSFTDIADDAELMQIVENTGPALFRDNCAMCHGQNGEGSVTFPRLNDTSWLWGDQPEVILKTLQVGINSGSEGSRVAQMPSFGKAGTLDAEAITNVSLYVLSFSNASIGSGTRVNELLQVQAGKQVYQANCMACHGAEGKGNQALGAPNLVDDYWLYGQDEKTLYETIWKGRQGHMPAWQDRLTLPQLKILTLYVLSLHKISGGKPGGNAAQ